jgi:hypothetical protein
VAVVCRLTVLFQPVKAKEQHTVLEAPVRSQHTEVAPIYSAAGG